MERVEVIEFNFPPSVAKKYILQWREQVENDKNADDKLRKIMQDVCALVDVGSKVIQLKTKA